MIEKAQSLLPLCEPAMEAECERLLSVRTRDIRLSGAMLRFYQAWSWRRRAKIARAWMLWVTVLNVVLCAMGVVLAPDVPPLVIVATAALVSVANFGVFRLWSRPRAEWIESLSLVGVTIATMICYGIFGVYSGGTEHERYLTGALFLATVGLIIFDLPRRWSIALSVLALAVYAAFQLDNPHLTTSAVVLATTFFGLGIAATVEARRTVSILAHKGFLMAVRDAHRRKALAEANESLKRLATLDPLTGIANRRSVKEHTDRLWQNDSVHQGGIAIIMADIDHFKRLNDTFGHAAGDDCIRRIANVMVAATRSEQDLVARYGGEEFIIVLTDAAIDTVTAIAERIRSAVEALAIANPGTPSGVVTVSLGIALARDGVGPERLATWADDALYEAKRLGRNRIATGPVDRTASGLRHASTDWGSIHATLRAQTFGR